MRFIQSIFIVFVFASFAAHAVVWTHIELGAGNYGAEGHTKKSQGQTVRKKIEVTAAPNYIDSLRDEDDFCYFPQVQYRLLFDTLDELVHRHGTDDGVFHVNDVIASYAEYAAQHLRDYAQAQGYYRTIIEAIPGDYVQIVPAQSLARFERALYDSAHLKNPEISLFAAKLDGDDVISTPTSRLAGRAVLQKLANLSHSGLDFFVIYRQIFFPQEERALAEKGIFYQTNTEQKSVPYYFPEGEYYERGGGVFPSQTTRVFFIPRDNPSHGGFMAKLTSIPK